MQLQRDALGPPRCVDVRRCGGVGAAASDVRLDVVLGFGEEGAEGGDVEDGAEGFEIEDEVRIGDAESVGAVGRNVSNWKPIRMLGLWGGGNGTSVLRGLKLLGFG